jgi:hypothetical protein
VASDCRTQAFSFDALEGNNVTEATVVSYKERNFEKMSYREENIAQYQIRNLVLSQCQIRNSLLLNY